MKRVDFCRLALQSGMDADPRGGATFSRERPENKAICDYLTPETMVVSDLDTYSNLYTDSRILHCSSEQNVNIVFAGIDDIETPELLIAGRQNEKNAVVEAVCAHPLVMVNDRSLYLFTKAFPG